MTARTIMVAYATRYGSTEGVATAVGERLVEHGLDARVQPVSAVRSFDGCSAVVLATPFYRGAMLKDARRFLDVHRHELAFLPVALLALGPVSATQDLAGARRQIDAALARIPWFQPVAAEMFVGRYDPDRLTLGDRLTASLPASGLRGVTAHDDRDWDAIRAWADTLPPVLDAVA